MIVLGIDPGSRRCGWGVVERRGGRLAVLASGVLAPGELPVPERLAAILEGLAELIARFGPDACAIERVFSGTSPRSALVLGQARGVALAAAARAGLAIFEYAPSAVKLAFTGSGRAGKEQMVRTARTLLGVAPRVADEADALAIAVCHLAGGNRTPRSPQLAPAQPHPGAPPLVAAQRARLAAARLVPARRDHRRGS